MIRELSQTATDTETGSVEEAALSNETMRYMTNGCDAEIAVVCD